VVALVIKKMKNHLRTSTIQSSLRYVTSNTLAHMVFVVTGFNYISVVKVIR